MSRLARPWARLGPRQVEMPSQDLLEPWADQIYQWLTGDRLLLTRIHELLLVRGCAVSYSSLRRFIVKRNWGSRSVRTVRMADTAPGEVAEVDFGRLGMITDPSHRQAQGGVGADRRAVVLTALFRVADAQPEAGGRDRRPGSGVGVFRRGAPLPGHRQFPRRGGWAGCAASSD